MANSHTVTGADLDRPALDQLRKDLKTPQFDTVYFHSADRIARDVMHQHIIIAELRKYEKHIIIDGKDYANNPENTFTLTRGALPLASRRQWGFGTAPSIGCRGHSTEASIPAVVKAVIKR